MNERTKRRVLAVDDDEFDISVITSCLGAEGIAVETADSAELALELIAGKSFDLVILDAKLSARDDANLLESLRKRHPATELPILLLTEISKSAQATAALAAGANEFVTKPLEVPILMGRVRTQLRLREADAQIAQARRALQHQSNHLRVVMDSATIAIFTLDDEGRFTSANQMTAEIAATAVADMIGVPFSSFIADEKRQEIEDLLAKVTKEGFYVTDHESEVVRPDESRRTVILSMRALTHDGRFGGIAGIANDVTDIWRQRKQLTAYIDSLMAPDPMLLGVLNPPAEEGKAGAKAQADVAVAKGEAPKPAQLGKAEDRVHRRHKVFKGAKLSFNNDQCVVDCTVRDQSESGARLQFDHHFDCPRFVVVRFSDGTVYDCEVRRFASMIMGLKFLRKH